MNRRVRTESKSNDGNGETLRDMLEALGMTSAELAARMGKPSEMVDDIIICGAPVSPATAMEPEKVFGV